MCFLSQRANTIAKSPPNAFTMASNNDPRFLPNGVAAALLGVPGSSRDRENDSSALGVSHSDDLAVPGDRARARHRSHDSDYLAMLTRSRASYGSDLGPRLLNESNPSASLISGASSDYLAALGRSHMSHGSSVSSDLGGMRLGDSSHSMDSYLLNESIIRARQRRLRHSLDHSHLLTSSASILEARRRRREDFGLARSLVGGDRVVRQDPNPSTSAISSDSGRTMLLGDSNYSMEYSMDVDDFRHSSNSHRSNDSIASAWRRRQEDFGPAAFAFGGDRNASVRSHAALSIGGEPNVGGGPRGGANIPIKKRTKLMKMKEVNFDPAPECAPGRPGNVRREEEDADAVRSLMSLSQGGGGAAPARDAFAGPAGGAPAPREISPAEARQLQKLAESIERTGRSRRQLMMQRGALAESRRRMERPADSREGR